LQARGKTVVPTPASDGVRITIDLSRELSNVDAFPRSDSHLRIIAKNLPEGAMAPWNEEDLRRLEGNAEAQSPWSPTRPVNGEELRLVAPLRIFLDVAVLAP
jgi:hypothetical protein